MKKLFCFVSILLLGGLLTACGTLFQPSPTSTPSTPPTQTPFTLKGIIKPGDIIGEMTITNEESKHFHWLFDSCNFNWTLIEPFSQTVKCTVPELPAVGIGPLWGAETSKLDSSLESMIVELYVDDNHVVLDEFGYLDLSYYDPDAGFDVTYRYWNVLLRNLTAGRHIIRFSWTMVSPVDDGWNIYLQGKYEYIADLTVTKKPDYSTLPPVPKPGQHAYTSKNGDLDFLLYVPTSYGVEPDKKWPLLVYLHDAEMRGSTDFLVKESLPKRLQTLKDFEFLVVSPLGNGGMDFWSKDEMIVPVMKLLDEIQSTYLVDAKRIYLTGAGMGGNGVWVMGMRNPDYFGALAPLGGYTYPFGIPENICNLKDVPVWAVHGEEDFMVPSQVEQDLVDAVNACGGTAKIMVKPEAIVPVDVYYRSEIFDWLLAQSKK